MRSPAIVESRTSLPGRCEGCIQPECPVVQGFGISGGLVVVGEAPGASEVQRGQPFVGESGRLIRSTLQALGVDPEDVYWTNSVLCRPPGNKTPSPTLIRACNRRLLEVELPLISPSKILAVGGIALTAILGAAKTLPITKWRGRGMMVPIDGREVYTVATYHPAAVLRDPDLFRDFADDIDKLLKNDHPMAPPDDLFFTIPKTPEEAIELLEELHSATFLSCDLETTGFNPITNKTLSIGFCALLEGGGGVSVVIPEKIASAPGCSRALWKILTALDAPTMVFHNAQFDLQFLHAFFGKIVRPADLVDTMLLHYGLDERPIGRYRAHGLKDLARIHYDAEDYAWDFETFFTTPEEERDYPALFKYQALDTYFTARLYEDLMKEMRATSPQTEKLMTRILWPAAQAFSSIEMRGLLVDQEYFAAFRDRTVAHLEDVGARLKALAKVWGVEDLNPNSSLQVQDLVFHRWKLQKGEFGYDRGGSGVRWYGGREMSDESTGKVALQFLIKTTNDPAIQQGLLDIIEYRVQSKILATYIDGILEKVDPDGRLRSEFRLAGTATGRLSSAEPNLQNIPAQKLGPEIRNGFISAPGYTFIEADYSQLELRVAAWYSGDEALTRTFQEGKDIHRIVAAKMFRKPEDQITSFQRYMAKFVDFGILYGRGAKSLTEGQEVEWLEEQGVSRWTLKEAEFFLNEFLDGFPGLAEWMKKQRADVMVTKEVQTGLGRTRRFPLIPARDRGAIERQAVNTPIQSLASDVCLMSLIKLHNTLPEGAYVLFSVHDSILFEVRDDLVDAMVPYIVETMSSAFPFPSDVPFPVDAKVGTRWGSLKEVARG